jgi:hypothetical protein
MCELAKKYWNDVILLYVWVPPLGMGENTFELGLKLLLNAIKQGHMPAKQFLDENLNTILLHSSDEMNDQGVIGVENLEKDIDPLLKYIGNKDKIQEILSTALRSARGDNEFSMLEKLVKDYCFNHHKYLEQREYPKEIILLENLLKKSCLVILENPYFPTDISKIILSLFPWSWLFESKRTKTIFTVNLKVESKSTFKKV